MADKKITALTALGAADKDADDRLHIIDYSSSPVNKQISLTNIAVKEKALVIAKKYSKTNKARDIIVLKEIVKSSKIENLAKNSDIHKRR